MKSEREVKFESFFFMYINRLINCNKLININYEILKLSYN